MKKSEMEDHRDSYRALLANALERESAGDFDTAIDLLEKSWTHVDGMMQFERKFEGKEFDSVESIDLTLKYAPLHLRLATLERLAALLKDQRRIRKNVSTNLDARLERSFELLDQARRLWAYLEENAESKQDELRQALDESDHDWKPIAQHWEAVQIVQCSTTTNLARLSFVTRMMDMVVAKCSSCGILARSHKAKFLTEAHCPKCGNKSAFVILAPAASK